MGWRKIIANIPAFGMLFLICNVAEARVLMSGGVNVFMGFDILPMASFTVDSWYSRENLWTITIQNADTQRKVDEAVIDVNITSSTYGSILSGKLHVVGDRGFLSEMIPGQSFTVSNRMVAGGSSHMHDAKWSKRFEDDVIKRGVLPEGSYTFNFTLQGSYDTKEPITGVEPLSETIVIRNPLPPELISPFDRATDVVNTPRFRWMRPLVSDLSQVNHRAVSVEYVLKVWRMYEGGRYIDKETAVTRPPVWDSRLTHPNLTSESVDFPSQEELVSGRRYCWQVQALDGTGRPISTKNDGKSEIWEFSVFFGQPVINESFSFSPFGFSWNPAQTGGTSVQYSVRISPNINLTGGYREENIVRTSFSYPDDAPPLIPGRTYYIRLRCFDGMNMPIGEPIETSFTMPTIDVRLLSPSDRITVQSLNPVFTWQSSAQYFDITIRRSESDWSRTFRRIQGTRWSYEDGNLLPGAQYAWTVTPVNEQGERLGNDSEPWVFSTPANEQVRLLSPVDEVVNSLRPSFMWTAAEGVSVDSSINYVINVEDGNRRLLHTSTTSATNYQYPTDIPSLTGGARYFWSVTAFQNGQAVGPRSESSFTTPFSAADDSDFNNRINQALQTISVINPQVAKQLSGKVVTGITDETGTVITPESFLEILDSYRVIKITRK